MRDAFPRFEGLDAEVLGVSPDGVASHQKFKRKHALPFTLLADTEHAAAERYGVWRRKSLFGHKYWGVERSTFVIDPAGRIAHVFEEVDTGSHGDDVAKVLERLRGTGSQRGA